MAGHQGIAATAADSVELLSLPSTSPPWGGTRRLTVDRDAERRRGAWPRRSRDEMQVTRVKP